MRFPTLSFLCLVGLAAPDLAQAQPADRLTQGLQAYRELEMESAGWLLRQALAGDELSASQRKQALSYLGAAEFYRDRRDSALSAYAQLIRLEPAYALDRRVFGPDVQAIFAEARRRTPIVDVTASRASFAADAPGLPVHLRANTPHVVVVTAELVDGTVVDTVFRDRIGDTATIHWNARGPAGGRPPVGGLVLGVTSLDARGRVSRRVALPVHVTRSPEQPLTEPTAPALLPDRQPAGPAWVRLGLGVAAATAAFFVTPLVTDDRAPQVALTAAYGVAGVIGFFELRPGKPLPDNVVANRVAREAWEARMGRVQQENERRAEGGTVSVDVGKVSGS